MDFVVEFYVFIDKSIGIRHLFWRKGTTIIVEKEMPRQKSAFLTCIAVVLG